MTKTKLALAIAAVALSAGASTASAHVMYNTALAADQVSGTDGWVWNGQGNPGYDAGTYTPWLGTSALPFGYTGQAALHWAAAVHHSGNMTVSAADAAADYNGAVVEIDTGAGAWRDANGTGWKHQTDIGLIKTDFDATIRITIGRVGSPSLPGLLNDNFGVTVFTGMDTTPKSVRAYSHHGGWNNPSISRDFTDSNPFYYGSGTSDVSVGTGMTYLTHDETVDMNNYIEFFATKGQVYTIALGGNGVGSWSQNVSGYELNISAVPVPGAVWLFGSAIAGLVGFGRRKPSIAA